MSKPRILVIVGPTAAGKTRLSLELADRLGAEIVSADSRQIFRYMDIVTAKPSKNQLAAVSHYFIDIVDPDGAYDAGKFGTQARALISERASAGRPVIIVGGSGLYVKSLVDGFFGDIGKDESVRKEIRAQMEVEGVATIHQRLKSIDPMAALKIHPNDAKRIERALEVFYITGERISSMQNQSQVNLYFEPIFVGLSCPREALYERINVRVDAMLKEGAIEETESLLKRGYSPMLVSMEGLGYREIIRFLNGELSRIDMINLFKQKSRNYAKRQLTWFRKDQRIKWLETDSITNRRTVDDLCRLVEKEKG